MTYTEKDFSVFQYNPLVKKDLDKFIATIPDEFKSHTHIHGLVSYTMLMYDPRSILIVREREIDQRKRTAAELANLKEMEDYFTLSDETLMTLVIWYLKTQVKSREFAAIVALEYKFWENISELMSPIVGESNKERLEAAQKKAVISQEIDSDIAKLNRYYKDFFGDDDAISTQVRKQSFRPENFARK